jgi:DNA-binding transcriptional LysR family regulator
MSQIRLDLNLIEIFCCVYEHQNFSRAAKQRKVSQPTISGHMKNLEEYVGLKLFDRLPKRVVPTRAGELLYRHGRVILNEKEAAVRQLNKLRNCIEGSLVICSSTTPGEYLLPQIIASFHANHPAVAVELRISDSEFTCHEVLSGKAELGVVGAKLNAVGLNFSHFASDQMVLVVPNTDEWRMVESITLEAVTKRPFLARENGSGSRHVFEAAIGSRLEEFNIVACLGSTNAIKEALRANLGVSVLSLLSVRTEIETGAFKIIDIEGIDPIKHELFTVTNKNLTLSPIAEAFLGVLEQAENVHRGNGDPVGQSCRIASGL